MLQTRKVQSMHKKRLSLFHGYIHDSSVIRITRSASKDNEWVRAKEWIQLLATALAALIALPANAEPCQDYFNRNNLRYKEISYSTRIYISWNNEGFVDCNNDGNRSFRCAGRSFSSDANSVYDNSGMNWSIDWTRTSDTYECSQGSDGVFVTTNDKTYMGTVANTQIPVMKVHRYDNWYRVIRPDF